ncbi:helix-turn-helix domain-containing protein, partial [bacterium]|nr:helix-turn-helix domain-containing protein [bacterium]
MKGFEMEKLLTVQDVSKILQVTDRTVYKYVNSGELKAIKLGKKNRSTRAGKVLISVEN